MKVLLVNHTLDFYAGSETFTYALAVELEQQGHHVVCFSPRLGPLAERLRTGGITVSDDLMTLGNDIDVIHGQHRYESLLAHARYPDKPMILVCHGVLPWQEQPIKAGLNPFRYVAVSEEVKRHVVENHLIDPGNVAIIRNGVDLKRFRSRRPIGARPKRALILSNHMPEHQRNVIRGACERLSIDLAIVGEVCRPVWNVEDYINDADLVFSLGRGALEAMACKRAVIVYGYDGADGLIRPENFHAIRETNFSGRARRFEYTENALSAEIEKYDSSIPESLFEFIEGDHDIRTVARCYIALYESALGHSSKRTNGTRWVSYYAAVKEITGEATELQTELKSAQAQLHRKEQELAQILGRMATLEQDNARLQQDNARLQRFADAVRRTFAYRFYRKFIRPLRGE
jgi:glycosyltransferase involved in cell wall biosynthesis